MAIVRIQLRRDTAANWTSADPVLAPGEIGLETDTDQFKIGDGSTVWSLLSYGGIQGPQGEPGVDGTDGVDGVAAATSPLTYDSGTNTIGIDQSAISITASQLSDVTATAAELNILDGVTATASEINVLDGITASTAELNYVDGVTSNIQTQLNAKAPLTSSVSAKTSAYTLAIGDRGNILTASGTFNITVPANVFAAGDRVDIINIGTGTITLAAGSGLTLNSKEGAATIDGQYGAASIVFTSATVAYRIGSLA